MLISGQKTNGGYHMRLGDFLKILVASIVIFNIFLAAGMPLALAISLAVVLMAFSLSSLNYLNHGKFTPIMVRSSNQGDKS